VARRYNARGRAPGAEESAFFMSPLASTTLRIGDRAPELALPTRDGELVDLSAVLDLGSVLLVFVPGTWSPATRDQLEQLELANQRFLQVGIAVVVVATQDRGRLAKALLHSNPSFLILSDGDRTAARDFGVYRAFSLGGIGITAPAYFLIDRDRSLRFVYVGQRDSDIPDTETILQIATGLVGVPLAAEIEPEIVEQETVAFPAVAAAERLDEEAEAALALEDDAESLEHGVVAPRATETLEGDATVEESSGEANGEIVASIEPEQVVEIAAESEVGEPVAPTDEADRTEESGDESVLTAVQAEPIKQVESPSEGDASAELPLHEGDQPAGEITGPEEHARKREEPDVADAIARVDEAPANGEDLHTTPNTSNGKDSAPAASRHGVS
jgi:thioredoxin-dependent peroxiredoxin